MSGFLRAPVLFFPAGRRDVFHREKPNVVTEAEALAVESNCCIPLADWNYPEKPRIVSEVDKGKLEYNPGTGSGLVLGFFCCICFGLLFFLVNL